MIIVKERYKDDLLAEIELIGFPPTLDDDFKVLVEKGEVTNCMFLFITAHVGWDPNKFYLA